MKVQGIHVNPRLRKMFDNTPNEERSPAEIARWWGVPYIVTCSWDQIRSDATYDDFLARMATYGSNQGWIPPIREKWEQDKAEQRRSWFEAWPSGVRYDVRCLDGGAWDRSTGWGMFATLEQAIACAKGE